MVEYIVVFVSLMLLTFGMFEVAMIYKASFTLDDATFRAAREGALQNGFERPMREKVVEGMAPLEMGSGGGIARYARAVVRTRVQHFNWPERWGGVRVDVLNPTREIFNQFSVNQYDLQTRRNIRQIPNDNLNARSAVTRRVNTRGENVNINVQDANLLKVRVHWCHSMTTPFVSRLIYTYFTRFGNSSPHWRACRNRTTFFADDGEYFIPISSDSVIRMQSPVRCENRNCTNLRN
ncbi:MAG: pilus assembly protein [Pseudomonadales bacterium]|nr:pilus assembly protein [Pseudomonadales bacterium]